jgi:hypothetical protein
VKQKQTTTTANTFYEYGMGQTVWAKAQACTAHLKQKRHYKSEEGSLRQRNVGSGDQAGPAALSGQSFEHVTVPDDFGEIKDDPNAFGRRLKEHLARLEMSQHKALATGTIGSGIHFHGIF